MTREEKLIQAEKLFKQGGISLRDIGKMVKIRSTTISDYLKDKGYEIVQNNQKYTYNTDVFKEIDTEEKAYWLGFLSADGCLLANDSIVELTLAEKDKDHVERFASFISRDLKVSYRKSTKSYRVSVCNKEIKEDLIALGVTPQKSLTLEFCSLIPSHLMHHYIRGYMDGDGSIYIRTDGQVQVELIGTIQFLDTVIEKLELKHNKKRMHGNAYAIRYSGNKGALNMLHHLYKDATIYLPRKYEKYMQVVESCRPAVKVAGV